MTQGKVERYHRSMKTQILLENYHLPGKLELALSRFVDYYDYERYHELLDNLTPVDVYCGRDEKILSMGQNIERRTLKRRRQLNDQRKAA